MTQINKTTSASPENGNSGGNRSESTKEDIVSALTEENENIEEVSSKIELTEQEFRDIFSNLGIEPMMELYNVEKGIVNIEAMETITQKTLEKLHNIGKRYKRADIITRIKLVDGKNIREITQATEAKEAIYNDSNELLNKVNEISKIFKDIFTAIKKTYGNEDFNIEIERLRIVTVFTKSFQSSLNDLNHLIKQDIIANKEYLSELTFDEIILSEGDGESSVEALQRFIKEKK